MKGLLKSPILSAVIVLLGLIVYFISGSKTVSESLNPGNWAGVVIMIAGGLYFIYSLVKSFFA